MDTATLVPMVENKPSRGFLESLRLHSEFLRLQADEFSKVIEDSLRDCQILSFYETEKSPTASWNEAKGKWEMTGYPAILVDPRSATHGRLRKQGTHYVDSINRAHSELVNSIAGRMRYTKLFVRGSKASCKEIQHNFSVRAWRNSSFENIRLILSSVTYVIRK